MLAPQGPLPTPARRPLRPIVLVSVIGTAVVLVVIAVVTVLALTVASHRVFAGPQLASGVHRVLTRDYQRPVSTVQCPHQVEARPGAQTLCQADGQPVTVHVNDGGVVIVTAP